VISSSGKSGSRTDTGLGRSRISDVTSRQLSFLVFEVVDGDVNGEDRGWFSSNDS
jgi:hypothetical protein